MGLMMTWTVAAPAISAAFLSSLVEAVEALTIVLAVGTVRGWRPAGLGAVAGCAACAHRLSLAAGAILLFGCLGVLVANVMRAARDERVR